MIISAPAQDNSGKGGALDFLHPLTALTKNSRAGFVLAGAPGVGTLPSDPGVFYVDSTPVGAVLYGIDVAALKNWGKVPDLVISGPNYGNNTGAVNNGSGTVNAALSAISRGIPAIAVSAAQPSSYRPFTQLAPGDREYEEADLIVRLVAQLEKTRRHANQLLLPSYVGLNVNIPNFEPGAAASLPIKFSQEGIAASAVPFFSEDLSKDPVAVSFGAGVPLPGVTLSFTGAPPPGLAYIPDTDPHSEQNVVKAGGVAISVIEGNHQADRQNTIFVQRKLRDLVNEGRRASHE